MNTFKIGIKNRLSRKVHNHYFMYYNLIHTYLNVLSILYLNERVNPINEFLKVRVIKLFHQGLGESGFHLSF